MYRVEVRFCGGLARFLPHEERHGTVTRRFGKRRSVKDLIESLGAPHTEVGRILVNGSAVDFSYIVEDRDRFEVFEVDAFRAREDDESLQPGIEGTPRFVCDVHLEKLARRLRLLGFDVMFEKDLRDEALAELAARENRILLTRDRRLLMRRNVGLGMHPWSDDPEEQTLEVLRKLRHFDLPDPFGRCTTCNGTLRPMAPDTAEYEEALAEAPPRVRQWRTEYWRCGSCGKLYWKGTHYAKLREKVEMLLDRFGRD